MATAVDIAGPLTMEEIPVKLRCAACNQLANNAFRMPCCDQSICESCQSTLPQACPVCLHEPVKADDCRPNKALRTTIKVFLRKKGIEREAARRKELLEKVAATPGTADTPQLDATPDISQSHIPTPLPVGQTETTVDGAQVSRGVSHTPQSANGSKVPATAQILSAEDQMDIPRPSIESTSEEVHDGVSQDNIAEMNGVQEKGNVEQEQSREQRMNEHEQWGVSNGSGQLINNGSFGFDATLGAFPTNMGFNGAGDFSQMMQFMPNSMPTNSMGAFPNMMGMPGMGMDPMAMSQGMYGGYGGQGMGMSGMNVGMGFNAGQSAFGGYNGQPTAAWNAGQDKFNQNSYGGHATGMGGDFGTNAGYGGYNMPQHQGNFTQMHHHQFQNNDFQNGYNGQGFHNRGRGRGRGYQNTGRGRGGLHQVTQGNQANYEPFHHQLPNQLAQQDSSQQQPSPDVQKGPEPLEQTVENSQQVADASTKVEQVADEQLATELEPGGAEDTAETDPKLSSIKEPPVEGDEVPPTEPLEAVAVVAEQRTPKQNALPENKKKPAAIETFISSDPKEPEISQVSNAVGTPSAMMPPSTPTIPLGPAALYSVDQSHEFGSRGRGLGRGLGLHRGTSDFRGGRGRGASFNSSGIGPQSASAQSIPSADIPVVAPTEPKGLGVEGAPKAPKALREGLPNTSMRGGRGFAIIGRASNATHARPNGHARSRSPSPARSRSPTRHQSHRHRTHRHRSTSSSNESERERRRERHRRHSRKHEDNENDKSRDVKEPQSREKSVDSSPRRSSHRSHREHGREKDIGRSNHRTHRSQRERSRERDGELRSGRKRSRSAAGEVNGTKRSEVNQLPSPTDSRRKEKPDESSHSSRKRREREDEERHRERKRSRRDRSPEAEEKDNNSHLRHSKRDETDTKPNQDQKSKVLEKAVESSNITPKKPETDHHTLEREARNRERLLKELQRREAMEGKGSAGKRRDSKVEVRTGPAARRVSYKYEDEESSEARASRVESEREAGRWR